MQKQCPSCQRRYPLVAFRDMICIECWELKRRRARSVARKALNDVLERAKTEEPMVDVRKVN